MIDTGSLVDVLFCLAYDQMGLLPAVLKSIDAPLYGLLGHSIQPSRSVEILLMIGSSLA